MRICRLKTRQDVPVHIPALFFVSYIYACTAAKAPACCSRLPIWLPYVMLPVESFFGLPLSPG